MNHQKVAQTKMVERYLLGELADSERNEFEEHYFSCAKCAEEVVMAVKFVDNARRPLLQLEAETTPSESQVRPSANPPLSWEQPAPKNEERWWDRWLALAPKPALAGACACLCLALTWQSLPKPAGPEVTGSYFVTATRAADGAPRKIVRRPNQERVALLFNHTDTTVKQFAFVLETAAGRPLLRFDGAAPGDTNDIQVLVPVAKLPAGIYTLRVKNEVTQSDVAALPFELVIP